MDAVSYSLASKQAQRIEKFIANPDSNSGVLTQPKVIEAGETVTIKSGRQAILADTVVNGNLVIEVGGEVFVPAGAGFSGLNQSTNTSDNTTAKLNSTNITVNVGAGQTYTTINQALEYLSGFYPMYKQSGVTATINLKAGFVMEEQVLVSGIDLGWITIVGEDAETIITHTVLTTKFNGDYPVFGVDKGGTSPIIGQLFRFNVEKVGGNKHGLMAHGAGSSAEVLSGKGFIGAGTNGIYAVKGSTINADSANVSNAKTFGIYAADGSTISADRANASNVGTYGIYAEGASTIDATGANASNAGFGGIKAGGASIINANGANASNAGSYGISAEVASTIDASNVNASNAGNSGIFAGGASTINAYNAIIENQTRGTARVRVRGGSTIDAGGINITGGTVPALSQAANTLTADGIIYQ